MVRKYQRLAFAMAAAVVCLHAQEGKKRIGIVLPEAQMGQGQAAESSVAEPVRAEWIKYLSGPTVDVVALSARVSVQIEAEAKAKKCDFVLYSTVVQKPGAVSTKKSFLKGATSAAHMMPMMGMARGLGGMMAAQAATSAVTGIAEATSMVKSKDEWTLSYRLAGADGATFAENASSAQATMDREDIISPLLRRTAEEVLGKVIGK